MILQVPVPCPGRDCFTCGGELRSAPPATSRKVWLLECGMSWTFSVSVISPVLFILHGESRRRNYNRSVEGGLTYYCLSFRKISFAVSFLPLLNLFAFSLFRESVHHSNVTQRTEKSPRKGRKRLNLSKWLKYDPKSSHFTCLVVNFLPIISFKIPEDDWRM